MDNVEIERITHLAENLAGALRKLLDQSNRLDGAESTISEIDSEEFELDIDRFSLVTAPVEQETLRITSEHPFWTAADVAAEVRRRLPGCATTDKGVRFYWKIARKHPYKRSLLPHVRLA